MEKEGRAFGDFTMSLEELIEEARGHVMTEAERKAQIISFAYGNVKLHNDAVTREMITEAVEELYKNK